MISAAFNFDNFWDGRARFNFNGGSVFGPADPQSHVFIDPGVPGNIGGPLEGATNGHIHPDLLVENPEAAEQPVRIKFSSLASQATGPVLSDFEMSFAGRNWAKVAKKLLQNQVTPLANQLVAVDDSRLGPFSNQGGSACAILGRATAAFRPGLCVSYVELIQLSFDRHLWHNTTQHLNGASAVCTSAENGELTPPDCDPFDGYRLTLAGGAASPTNRDQFRQIEANFTLFFGLSVQAYEQLLIPDDTPFDRFMDANPRAGNGVGQPGEQGVLPPDQVADLVGPLTMVEGFGPDELFGFDIFAGANLTAALPVGSARNPDGVGSNPFLRTARCMLCHLGPEQTDHTSSVAHGLLLSDTEFELPAPGAAEPTGPFKFVTGFVLADELEEVAQDGVEVENRNFSILPQIPPGTSYDPALAPYATQIGLPNGVAFQDNGVYNIGLRPTSDDIGRGGTDAFGWPLLLASLALKNLEVRIMNQAHCPTSIRMWKALGCMRKPVQINKSTPAWEWNQLTQCCQNIWLPGPITFLLVNYPPRLTNWRLRPIILPTHHSPSSPRSSLDQTRTACSRETPTILLTLLPMIGEIVVRIRRLQFRITLIQHSTERGHSKIAWQVMVQ